jgi:hypothetical protein
MSRGSRSAGAVSLLGLLALAASQFVWVRWTNFGGVDEWLYLSLTSRGSVSFPQANRPLTLVWSLPAAWLTPGRFSGFLPLHAAYLALGAWLVGLLVRRIEPGATRFAFLAAAFTLVWAPLDMARLAVVQTSVASGTTLGAILAIFLFVESWLRARTSLLAAALAVAFVAARGYEATLGLLAGAPIALLAIRSQPDEPEGRHRQRTCLLWELGIVLLGILSARPLLEGGAAGYQVGLLGLDLDPRRYAGRLATQYALHLAPLWPADPSELVHVGVAAAVLVFLVAAWAARADAAESGLQASRRRLAGLAGLGLVLAGLGYSLLALSPAVVGATRTQFLSAPGMGLFLAAALGLVGSFVPSPVRAAAVLAAAAAIVAVGTGHLLGMQREWNRISAYPAQRQALAGLVETAPMLRPNTLVLLLDEDRVFSHVLTFRHAISLVYGDAVVGYSLESDRFLYDIHREADGLRVLPWPVIRGPWGEAPTFHRWDEIAVFRLAGGRVSLLERWRHAWLPALPAGATYAPRECITTAPAPPGRRALDRPPPPAQ